MAGERSQEIDASLLDPFEQQVLDNLWNTLLPESSGWCPTTTTATFPSLQNGQYPQNTSIASLQTPTSQSHVSLPYSQMPSSAMANQRVLSHQTQAAFNPLTMHSMLLHQIPLTNQHLQLALSQQQSSNVNSLGLQLASGHLPTQQPLFANQAINFHPTYTSQSHAATAFAMAAANNLFVQSQRLAIHQQQQQQQVNTSIGSGHTTSQSFDAIDTNDTIQSKSIHSGTKEQSLPIKPVDPPRRVKSSNQNVITTTPVVSESGVNGTSDKDTSPYEGNEKILTSTSASPTHQQTSINPSKVSPLHSKLPGTSITQETNNGNPTSNDIINSNTEEPQQHITSGNNRRQSQDQQALVSESDKHNGKSVGSEQKRRTAIRDGFKTLCTIVPGLSQGGTEPKKRSRKSSTTSTISEIDDNDNHTSKKAKKANTIIFGHGHGGASKSVILLRTIEYIKWINARNVNLAEEVVQLQSIWEASETSGGGRSSSLEQTS